MIFFTATAGLSAWLLLRFVQNDLERDSAIELTGSDQPLGEHQGHLELPKPLKEVVHPLTDSTPPEPPEENKDEPAAVESLPHVPHDGNPYRLFVSTDHFAQKYSNATTEELVVARAILGEESLKEMADATAAYLDSGRGELRVEPYQPQTDELIMPEPHKSYGMIETERKHVEGNSVVVLTGQLPWDEYAWLYDKQDEVRWLAGELIRRERAAAAAALEAAPNQGK